MNFVNKLMNAMGITPEEFDRLNETITLDRIESPDHFEQMEVAVARIEQAMRQKEKIMIYGDYDCDGICSVSILVKTFAKRNYPVGYYIPSRYKDGYGINEALVDEIKKKGYSLIITVDNGVRQFSALKRAKDYGIDVILTDHHEFADVLPECFCLIHPFRKIQDPMGQCGAYVAFMLSIRLLDRIDEYLLSLAALATVSDVMPMNSHNRNLVRYAVQNRLPDAYPNLTLLSRSAPIDERAMGYVIAPKINAVGRVMEDASPNRVVKFLISEDRSEMLSLASFIDSVNEERKRLCQSAYSNLPVESIEKSVLVYSLPSLKEGLIGLVAARISAQKNKPVIVFTSSENGLLKGSGRSLPGFSLVDAFEQLSDQIVVYGGHALAGGLTIREENLESFTSRIQEIGETACIQPRSRRVIGMEEDDFTYENYLLLRNLGPYGEGFEEPYLSYEFDTRNLRFMGNQKQHFRGTLNGNCSLVCFNYDPEKIRKEKITLIGRLDLDNFAGNRKIVFTVTEIME